MDSYSLWHWFIYSISNCVSECLLGSLLLNRTLFYDRAPSPALVKGVYLDPVVCVLLQDFLCVFICVERVHEDQRYVCVVSLVQVL